MMIKRARAILPTALAVALCFALALPLSGCSEPEPVAPPRSGIYGWWVRESDGMILEFDRTWMIVSRPDGERVVIAHSGVEDETGGTLETEIFEWARKDQPGLSDEAPKWAITVVDAVEATITFTLVDDQLTFDTEGAVDDFKIIEGTFVHADPPRPKAPRSRAGSLLP